MNPFEAGFAAGEADAWRDKQAGRLRQVPPEWVDQLEPYARGWWAGYTPRSLAWTLTRQPVRVFCDEEPA